MSATTIDPRTARDLSRSRSCNTTIIVLALYVGLIVVAYAWGRRLIDGGTPIKLATPPLRADWDVHVSSAHVVVLGLGAVLLVGAPKIAARASWRTLLWTAPIVTAMWTVALNSTRGTGGLLGSIENPHDYLADVGGVGTPLSFLRGFTDHFADYSIHTQGHPPGFVVVLWTLRAVGFGGPVWAASFCVATGSLAVVAVLVTVRDVAGESTARAAAPFVMLAPIALWVATSADAFFALLAACAIAGAVRAAIHPDRSIGPAIFGGVCFGFALLCSYGIVLIAVVPIVVALRLGRVVRLVPAGVAAVSVLLLASTAGFGYFVGLSRTREAYFLGVAHDRPYSYALLANLAALAIAVGPAVAVAIVRMRGRLAVLVGGAVFAVVLADLSGMSKLEVERIWLPFALWLLPAGAVLVKGRSGRAVTNWLALQMGCALVVQTMVRTGW